MSHLTPYSNTHSTTILLLQASKPLFVRCSVHFPYLYLFLAFNGIAFMDRLLDEVFADCAILSFGNVANDGGKWVWIFLKVQLAKKEKCMCAHEIIVRLDRSVDQFGVYTKNCSSQNFRKWLNVSRSRLLPI